MASALTLKKVRRMYREKMGADLRILPRRGYHQARLRGWRVLHNQQELKFDTLMDAVDWIFDLPAATSQAVK